MHGTLVLTILILLKPRKQSFIFFFFPPPGEELIYLDPHTTQPAVEPCEDGKVPDETYHCQHPPCRMHICELDPSIAAVEIPGRGFIALRSGFLQVLKKTEVQKSEF